LRPLAGALTRRRPPRRPRNPSCRPITASRRGPVQGVPGVQEKPRQSPRTGKTEVYTVGSDTSTPAPLPYPSAPRNADSSVVQELFTTSPTRCSTDCLSQGVRRYQPLYAKGQYHPVIILDPPQPHQEH